MKKNKPKVGFKSPLKDKPLRNPGQSLDEEINLLVDDVAIPWSAAALVSVILAALEWWRWYSELPYSPLVYTALACSTVFTASYKIIKLRNKVKVLKLGRDGERAVGQYLELLRSEGYRIFHDIVGESFNIDHVIICEHGVFTVETKTYSKPQSGEARISLKGRSLTINGYSSDSIGIQAKAESAWLAELLLGSTGRKVDVHPVILFPGWYVDSKGAGSDLWALNPKALPTFIKNSPKIHTKEDVMLFTYHISRYIRTT